MIKLIICSLCICIAKCSTIEQTRLRTALQDIDTPLSKDAKIIPEMLVPELISFWGYPVEEHFVTTEDGYILGLHRIPRGRGEEPSDESRPVVYFQHGLTSSSSSWTFGPPEKSLGYVLADAGYDVWMGNSRGNTYSRNHTSLEVCSDERCKEFWDFDWHEGGLYDVTAGIDYALGATGETQLDYVGHSMGCTQYLVAMSSRPEYNDKIRLAVLMSPPAFMTHGTNPLFDLADMAGNIEIIYHLFGHYEFAPHSDFISWFAHMFCSDEHPGYQDLCLNIGFSMLGFDPEKVNGTMIPIYLDNIPEGTSTRTAAHYAQLYLSGNFEAYDFGLEGNMLYYQQYEPPVYDLSKVVAPTAIFKADKDGLVNPADVDILVSLLPNVVFDHLVEQEGWTHLDYIMAMNTDIYVYPHVLDLLKQYSSN